MCTSAYFRILSALAVCSRNALYKSTFYLLTYLLTGILLHNAIQCLFSPKSEVQTITLEESQLPDILRTRPRTTKLCVESSLLVEYIALDNTRRNRRRVPVSPPWRPPAKFLPPKSPIENAIISDRR